MNPIAAGIEPIQIVSMIVVVAIIVVIFAQIKQCPYKYLWFIAMLFWMVHGLLFYIVLFLDRAGLIPLPFDPSYTVWSSILRLHGYLTILSVEVARWYYHRIKARKSNG